MTRNLSANRLAWILSTICAMLFTTVRAQTITHVEFSLPSLDYDVVYLADFVDVTNNKLARDIPNFSGSITADGQGRILLDVSASVQLRGEGVEELVFAETEPFTIDHTRMLTSADFAVGGNSGIVIKGNPYRENTALRDRIQKYAEKFPTAPVGQYFIEMAAFTVTPAGEKGTLVGKISRTINVRNASPEEVQVNLIEPQPGATIATTFPTFSWNSPNPKVTLYVYEKLPVYQSLQEAITGVPYLKQDLEGAQTFTYPSNALRRLEQNKSYVWFVEASVVTNRQTVMRRSEVRLFRIRLDDRQSQEISDMMNGFGGSAGGTFSTLQNMGWTPSGSMTLDGKPVSLDDLKALVAKLVAQNITVTIHVE